jgi:hypothetical protein
MCELRAVTEKVIEIASRLEDRRHKDKPVEMRTTIKFDGGSDFSSFLASNVRALLERTIHYRSLVESVRSRKTIAFIGSGLSIELGYPSWTSILNILAAAAGIDYSDGDITEGGAKALAIVESCKEKLQETYYQILATEFAEKKPGYTVEHLALLQIPFASYMTTNIDPCLEVAAEHIERASSKDRSIQIWPEFTKSYVGSGDIFYLHGKVPRQGQTCKIERVRMTTSEYKEAYVDSSYISDLFKQAVDENYVLLFIGYGLREPAIKELLTTALRRKKIVAEHVKKYDIPLDTQQVHFAFVPQGEMPRDELAELLKSCQVAIIDFPARPGYLEFKSLVDDLYSRTVPITALPVRHYGGSTSVDEQRDL